MFHKKRESFRNRDALIVSGLSEMSLSDTFLCGQAFRFEEILKEEDYIEYMTVVGSKLIFVGQRTKGELIFYSVSDEEFEKICLPYFALSVDYGEIRRDIKSRTDSEWLMKATDAAAGIRILNQDPWETLFSFIISQNNNIPRIRKIIRLICLEYGKNLAKEEGLTICPKTKEKRCESMCKECGSCFSFPTPEDIIKNPEGLLPSHPGFRYKYLLDAAKRVFSGETDLADIKAKNSFDYTVTELKKILGVGDKVASCVALFGFSNLEAFPIDVWMKRAIEDYFDGYLDHQALGQYRGVAQQYIFHYIRNLKGE